MLYYPWSSCGWKGKALFPSDHSLVEVNLFLIHVQCLNNMYFSCLSSFQSVCALCCLPLEQVYPCWQNASWHPGHCVSVLCLNFISCCTALCLRLLSVGILAPAFSYFLLHLSLKHSTCTCRCTCTCKRYLAVGKCTVQHPKYVCT